MSADTKVIMGQPISKAEFDQMKAMMAEGGADMMGGLDDAFGSAATKSSRSCTARIGCAAWCSATLREPREGLPLASRSR